MHPLDIRFALCGSPARVAGRRAALVDVDAGQTTEEQRAAAPVRHPGPDRDAVLEQRAALIDEVRALQALIRAKRRHIRALESMAGVQRPFEG